MGPQRVAALQRWRPGQAPHRPHQRASSRLGFALLYASCTVPHSRTAALEAATGANQGAKKAGCKDAREASLAVSLGTASQPPHKTKPVVVVTVVYL